MQSLCKGDFQREGVTGKVDYLQELQQDLECDICTEIYLDPRALICQHIFCLKCLKSLARTGTNRWIVCPLCRKGTPLGNSHNSAKEVEGLPKAIVLNRVTDTVHCLLASLHCKKAESVQCGLCDAAISQPEATLHCQQCIQHLCDACFNKHLKITGFQNHTCVSVNDLVYCKQHENAVCQQYCSECMVPACLKCLLGPHWGHQNRSIQQCMEDVKGKIQKALTSMNEEVDILDGQMAQNWKDSDQIQQKYSVGMKSVNSWRRRLSEKVNRTADDVLTRLETNMMENAMKLNQQRQDIAKSVNIITEKKELAVFGLGCQNLDILQFAHIGDDCNKYIVSSNVKRMMTRLDVSSPVVQFNDVDITNACTVQHVRGEDETTQCQVVTEDRTETVTGAGDKDKTGDEKSVTSGDKPTGATPDAK